MLARSYGQPNRKSTSGTFPKNIFKPYSEIVEIDECDFFCQLNIVNNCLMTLLDDLIFINLLQSYIFGFFINLINQTLREKSLKIFEIE